MKNILSLREPLSGTTLARLARQEMNGAAIDRSFVHDDVMDGWLSFYDDYAEPVREDGDFFAGDFGPYLHEDDGYYGFEEFEAYNAEDAEDCLPVHIRLKLDGRPDDSVRRRGSTRRWMRRCYRSWKRRRSTKYRRRPTISICAELARVRKKAALRRGLPTH